MNEENKSGTETNTENSQIAIPDKPQNSVETKLVPDKVPPERKKDKKKSRGRRIVALILAIVILAGAATGIIIVKSRKKATTASTLTTATVTKGNIANTITGSGEVEPKEKYTVVPTVAGEILTDNIEEGQTINKGDLLYTIDSTNAQNSIQQAENTLERAQLTYNQSLETLDDLKVKSDLTGVITKVYVKNGDQVQANAPVMDIQDSSSLKLTIPFNASDVANMYDGEGAQVTLESSGTVLSGTVSSIYTGQSISSTGAVVTNVDITVSNPGAVASGDTATAVVGGQYACNTAGTIAYSSSGTVTAKTSGQVTGLTLRAGDSVTSGSTIATLVNDSAQNTVQTNALAVSADELSLQNAKDNLKNYNIASPISGTVIEKDSKAGDTISNTNSSTTMAIIADMSSLVLDIDVDELDILNLKVGQTAAITADAVPNKTFTGEVTSVSNVGNSGSGSSSSSSSSSSASTGVTTYTVEITITDYGELLPGMNVNASIVTESASNVLLIPEKAVINGGYVLKKTDTGSASSSAQPASPSAHGPKSGTADASASGAAKTSAAGTASPNTSDSESGASDNAQAAANRLKALQAKAPAGYEYVKIQVGITNSQYAEILSGLKEGDEIAYETQALTASSSSGSSSATRSGTAVGGGAGMGGPDMGGAGMGGGTYSRSSGSSGFSANRGSGSSGSSANRTATNARG